MALDGLSGLVRRSLAQSATGVRSEPRIQIAHARHRAVQTLSLDVVSGRKAALKRPLRTSQVFSERTQLQTKSSILALAP